MNSKISYAIAMILGGVSIAAASAASATEAATDTTEAGTDMLAEITVTAQRRTQNIQDVPISMQALTAETLQQLNITRVIEFLARSRIPGMFQARENVQAGGLVSYGASLPDLFRRAAGYAHKILTGTKPADLPVEEPAVFELAVNLKTAKALGLTIQESFLLRADQVIE